MDAENERQAIVINPIFIVDVETHLDTWNGEAQNIEKSDLQFKSNHLYININQQIFIVFVKLVSKNCLHNALNSGGSSRSNVDH